MVIWMKSSICALSVISKFIPILDTKFDPKDIQKAAYLEEITQMEQFG